MNWNYPFGSTEIFFIILFILAYSVFLVRTIRVAQRLNTTARTLILKLFLRSGYFALLLISLLGPSFGEASREIQAKGKDIFLLVDLSKSMDATDVSPSRLEKVKFELKRFIENEHGNRIGIIIFSNESFVQVPLTYDRTALALFVQSLQTSLLPTSGTNICGAMELAFKKLVSLTDQLSGRAKMIVLFSDGENKADCPNLLYNNLRRFGVGTYVVAVGTKTGISIQNKGKALLDDNGKIVISRRDDGFLKGLAGVTRGIYYELTNEKSETNRLIADINSADGALVDTRTVTVASNKYFYFLGAALFLIIMDVLITIGTFRL